MHNEYIENIENHPSEKCPCGKVGRFKLYRGHMKLCLDCMQYWLTEKTRSVRSNEQTNTH